MRMGLHRRSGRLRGLFLGWLTQALLDGSHDPPVAAPVFRGGLFVNPVKEVFGEI